MAKRAMVTLHSWKYLKVILCLSKTLRQDWEHLRRSPIKFERYDSWAKRSANTKALRWDRAFNLGGGVGRGGGGVGGSRAGRDKAKMAAAECTRVRGRM